MTPDSEQPRKEKLGKVGAQYRTELIRAMSAAWGNRPSDGIRLSPDEEVQRWIQPTSDAATIALEQGGRLEDAVLANAMSAQQAKAEQQALTQQLMEAGKSPKEIFQALQQAGRTDEQIFQAHQKYAHALGKVNGRDDPKTEADYHAKMAEKARAFWARRPAPVAEPTAPAPAQPLTFGSRGQPAQPPLGAAPAVTGTPPPQPTITDATGQGVPYAATTRAPS